MDHDMAGMDHGAMGGMTMHGLLGGYGLSREASGTSWQPQAASHSGIHLPADDWMVMLHGRVHGIADWQSGPRGGDQVFSSSMVMGMAAKDLANGGTLGFKAMLSGDAFMGRRGYPLLLAAGETADGRRFAVAMLPENLPVETGSRVEMRFGETAEVDANGPARNVVTRVLPQRLAHAR